jgi:hypothetical protein
MSLYGYLNLNPSVIPSVNGRYIPTNIFHRY